MKKLPFLLAFLFAFMGFTHFAHAAISRVQYGHTYPGNSVTLDGTTAGNFLMVALSANSQTTPSCSDGVNSWTLLTNVLSPVSGANLAVFYAPDIAGGDDTITCTALSDVGLTAVEYSGVATTDPIDTYATSTGGGTNTPLTVGPITLAGSGEGAFAAWSNETAGRLPETWDAPYELIQTDTGHYDSQADYLNTTGATTSAGMSDGQDRFDMALVAFKPAGGSPPSYSYYRSLTVTGAPSIASGTQPNFPMLVSSTLSSWKSVANGGKIQNLVTAPNGGQEPADLIFATSSSNCNATPLNFETESYSSSTGALVDWVNVPSLSAGTTIYVCYDNTAVTTDQSHPSSTWNSNYADVYHMNGTSTATIYNSTGDGTTLMGQDSPTPTSSGLIGGAVNFPNTNQYGQIYASSSAVSGAGTGNLTISSWVNFNSLIASYDGYGGDILNIGENSYPNGIKLLGVGATGSPMFFLYNGGAGPWVLQDSNTIATGTWYYLSGTVSSTLASFYVNGILVATTTIVNSFIDAPVCMSGDYSAPCDTSFQRAIDGVIDESRISSVALSPSWILTEYNNQDSPSTFYAVGNETSAGSLPAPPVTMVARVTTAITRMVLNGVHMVIR